MEMLSYQVLLLSDIRMTCPLCGASMEGLGHAKTSGCPHIVAMALSDGLLKDLHVEDFGSELDLRQLIQEKASIRSLLEDSDETTVTQEDLLEAWSSLATVYPESVLVEFLFKLREESEEAALLCQGLFVMDNSFERERFVQDMDVQIDNTKTWDDPPSKLRQLIILPFAFILWLGDNLIPGFEGWVMKRMDALLDRYLKWRGWD